MEVLDRLGAEHLRAAVVAYRDVLAAHRDALNRLNVYPVPDGDTGTNMALTLDAVVAELPEPGGGDDGAGGMGAVCQAVGHGSLMGARGNSGVILSQILRGFTDRLAGSDGADAPAVADALAVAAKAAYRAVMHPVEGTILTVAREAADAAVATAGDGLVPALEAAAGAARAALERTPEQLAVLAEAGVVDAGGAGFVLFLDALLSVAASRPLPEPPSPEAPVTAVDGHGGTDQGGPRYEVMFLLDATEEAMGGFKSAWDELGESIVVVGGDGTWNCHVHTDDIGAALEAGVRAGRPHRIEVNDLHGQAHDRCGQAAAEARGAPGAGEGATADVPLNTAVVAVAAGGGITRILRSLGAARVVPGGQSMNPSTADILAAIQGLAAKEVVILPNNKNVVAVAEQAARAASGPVSVVPTTTVTQAFAALLAYDAGAGADANARAMSDAAGRVATAEVTRAVRDAATPAGPVRAGDWLGVTADGITAVAADAAEAACAVLGHLLDGTQELVTVVEGEAASPEGTRRITGWLASDHPELTVEVHHGGQPLSAWLLSAE